MAHGIRVIDPNIGHFTWPPFTYEKRSYALFRHLAGSDEQYDFIHFHDYKGLGFFTLSAKVQGLAFADTLLIVQAHGPSRWALQANDHPFQHEEQLKIDFMERQSVARADILVSPSAYMIRWLKENAWTTPSNERIAVIQNVCCHLEGSIGSVPERQQPLLPNEIIFFGRHEERKGIELFCDALDLVQDTLLTNNTTVTFLGEFGTINGEMSALYLARRTRNWTFPIQILPGYDRTAAIDHLISNERSIVVVPSRVEKQSLCGDGGCRRWETADLHWKRRHG